MSDAPKRIQLSRRKGWRKPEGAVVVARPSRWGNPFRVADCIEEGFAATAEDGRRVCTEAFRSWLDSPESDWAYAAGERHRLLLLATLHELAGHDLACWCPLDQACHADVLLDLANRVEQ